MNCVICQNNLPEFRLVNKSSFKQTESDYVEVCLDCLGKYSEREPDAILLLPRKIIKLSHYIKREIDKDMYTELRTKIPWIYEEVESDLYKFEIYLGIENPNDKSSFCVITEDFNTFQESKNLLNTSINNYKSAPNYIAIYKSSESQIIAIYKIINGVVQTLDPEQGLTFQALNQTNLIPLSIPANRPLLNDIILKRTQLQLFTDIETMQGYFVFPKVIEKNM